MDLNTVLESLKNTSGVNVVVICGSDCSAGAIDADFNEDDSGNLACENTVSEASKPVDQSPASATTADANCNVCDPRPDTERAPTTKTQLCTPVAPQPDTTTELQAEHQDTIAIARAKARAVAILEDVAERATMAPRESALTIAELVKTAKATKDEFRYWVSDEFIDGLIKDARGGKSFVWATK